MSKHSKSRLTGSRKKRGRARAQHGPAPKAGNAWLDSVDTIHAACAAIEMLSGLLAGYGEEPLEAPLAREAGLTLREHIRQLRAAWDAFTKEQP
jgi:hypothetical protein